MGCSHLTRSLDLSLPLTWTVLGPPARISIWGRWWEIWWWETWVESHFSIRADAWSRPNHGRNSGLLAPLPSLRQCNVPCNHKCPRKVACLNPRHLGDSAREISFTAVFWACVFSISWKMVYRCHSVKFPCLHVEPCSGRIG